MEPNDRLVDGPLEHVGDRLAPDPNVEHLALETAAAAGVAGNEDVGEEDHLDQDLSRALALLAAAAAGVERERRRGVPARPSERLIGEQLPDLVETLDIGDGIGSGGSTDWRLIDQHDVLQPLV